MRHLWTIVGFFLLCMHSNFLFAGQDSALQQQATPSGMVSLSDEELAQEQGQALFNLSYLAPGDSGNPYGTASNLSFYTLSMEAQVSLNANIKNLQLGCGGVNGAGDCDVDISNFSLGCIAGPTGECITLNPVGNQKPGAVRDCGTSTCTTTAIDTSQQKEMKDFVLTNPFYQFAIRNPNSAATRQLVGIRIGAANALGPMSFGSLNTFSGYLTGGAHINMLADNNVAVTNPNAFNQAYNLGLTDFDLISGGSCGFFSLACASQVKVSYNGAVVDYTAVGSGNRLKRAMIDTSGPGNLSSVVDGIMGSLSITDTSGAILGIINAIPGGMQIALGLLRDGIGNSIKGQLQSGLEVSDLSTAVIPYNLSNVHQLNINANDFGISVQKESIQYPGYAAAVPAGWGMHLKDAFTLQLTDLTSTFVKNIVAAGHPAANGNIVPLEAPYRNCWGTLTFC